jgi:hypothetical protein
MTPRGQDLLRDVLTLPEEERAGIAAELIASLEGQADNPTEVEAAWAIEIERRARRVLRGDSAGEAWSEVRRRIAAQLQTQ